MSDAKGDALLLARAEDLVARAARGEVAATAFLTPAEQALLRRQLPHFGEEWRFWGGYAAAERARAVFLPPYLAALDEPWRTECLMADAEALVAAMEIRGSGYRELSHRDYLGAILHLGVSRERVGDIAVAAPDRAVVFCEPTLIPFFAENLTRVASDKVTVARMTVDADFDGGRKFESVTDTVASPRADAVVAALANLSRERAQALFREERVEIDYETETRPDRTVSEGAVLSVRGVGKFIIRALSDKTKKGRYRLLADRYI